MASVEIRVEIKCAECGKELTMKGSTVRGLRSSWTRVEDVWTTDWNEHVPSPYLKVSKGYDIRYRDPDDEEDFYCSEPCLLKFLARVLPQMRRSTDAA